MQEAREITLRYLLAQDNRRLEQTVRQRVDVVPFRTTSRIASDGVDG